MSRHSIAAIFVVSGGMGPTFKIIQALIIVLITCMTEKEPFKNDDARVVKKYSDFFR